MTHLTSARVSRIRCASARWATTRPRCWTKIFWRRWRQACPPPVASASALTASPCLWPTRSRSAMSFSSPPCAKWPRNNSSITRTYRAKRQGDREGRPYHTRQVKRASWYGRDDPRGRPAWSARSRLYRQCHDTEYNHGSGQQAAFAFALGEQVRSHQSAEEDTDLSGGSNIAHLREGQRDQHQIVREWAEDSHSHNLSAMGAPILKDEFSMPQSIRGEQHETHYNRIIVQHDGEDVVGADPLFVPERIAGNQNPDNQPVPDGGMHFFDPEESCSAGNNEDAHDNQGHAQDAIPGQMFAKEAQSDDRGQHGAGATRQWIDQRHIPDAVAALQQDEVAEMKAGASENKKDCDRRKG